MTPCSRLLKTLESALAPREELALVVLAVLGIGIGAVLVLV